MPNFNLDSQEVRVIPVDLNGRTLLLSDMKIEGVDSNYRSIFNQDGLAWKLPPGDYKAKIFLRNLQMKTIPIRVVPGVSRYQLQVETGNESLQRVETQTQKPALPAPVVRPVTMPKKNDRHKRYDVHFPVAYRTDFGNWVSSHSIDLSTSGVCLENVGHAGEGENLYVRLHVPIHTVPIECPARVVWTRAKDVAKPRMGLQLYLTANMRSSLDSWFSLISL